ncbi:pyridoxamine 5'-phosphate oxidase [Palleronia sp. LCG004]|uniref:pyridoxamine 5'-phosphate oxidase n=1 Tax=Palleronia sp. LCG004 TaxID=3079304 RepID=UPI0029422953|nr:pyridoxamine 5'-phosphate oxidase [Palleronia sp. LCG004]WOI55243.1 pyridoxamine 5'-phosphate oxidase [Palleronia sp. LCG004]
MGSETSIFGADDPFALTRAWLAEAEATEPNDPNAIALSTVDAEGMPNVRIVLLKGIEDDAFVFYTNYESAKAEEIAQSGKCAFVMHWKSLRRQVRVRGTVTREDGATADVYYASRPLASRHGAWASLQSRPLESRAELEARVADVAERFGDNPPRPDFWGGFRIRPTSFEFWADGAFRLHDREVWKPSGEEGRWTTLCLFP